MIGKIIIGAFLILLFAGLGFSGIVNNEVRGFHNIEADPQLHVIGSQLFNTSETLVQQQIQNITSNALHDELIGAMK